MKAKIGSIYLSVKDMDRAIDFYENILNKKVSSENERMSSFDFGDFSLLLYNPEVDGEEIEFGNNTIINFEVENIEEIKSFIESKNCEIIMPLEKIETFLIFQCKDLEGNVIEFYQNA